MLLNIGRFGSLGLSGCLTGCGEISRFALSASKSRGLDEGGDKGGRAEMPVEFWAYVSLCCPGIFCEGEEAGMSDGF